MRTLFIILAGMLAVIACSAPAQTGNLRILTEDYPPFNYVDEKGNLTGQATEIVRAITDKLGQKINIEVMPWDQAYELAQKEPNVALYSTARTPERENLFLWVGPLVNQEKYLFARKGSGIKITSLVDVKNARSIAAVRNESGLQYILDQGGEVSYCTTNSESLKKMMDGGADLWLGPRADLSVMAKKAGVNADEIEPVFLVHSFPLYIAFNKNTPASVVQQWQQALESIKK